MLRRGRGAGMDAELAPHRAQESRRAVHRGAEALAVFATGTVPRVQPALRSGGEVRIGECESARGGGDGLGASGDRVRLQPRAESGGGGGTPVGDIEGAEGLGVKNGHLVRSKLTI